MKIEMVGVEQQLLAEIADDRMKREDVALTYAFGLRSSEQINWAQVNRAIMDRWSMAALKWIKTRAWKLHDDA